MIQIQHPRMADTALAVSGGTFLTAHWFLVADKLMHFGAETVSVVTGVSAAAFYIPKVYRRTRSAVARLLLKL